MFDKFQNRHNYIEKSTLAGATIRKLYFGNGTPNCRFTLNINF